MGTYGFPQCFLAERGRALLGYIIILTGGLCLVMGILIMMFSFTILQLISPYTAILEEYNNNPYFIIYLICGIVQAVINLVATCQYKTACRSKSRELSPSGSKYLLQYWLLVLVSTVIIILACALTVGIQLKRLDNALAEGLGSVMSVYVDGGASKMTMDRIQMDFQCCGSSGPEDWYTVAWQQDKYLRDDALTRVQKTNVYHVADVPFSCCDSESPVTPCQHQDINNVAVHGEIFETINEGGCQVAMLDYFKESLLLPAAIFLTCITVIQMINIMLMRFLQTSIDNLKWASPGKPEGVSPAYIIAQHPPKSLPNDDSEEISDC